MDRVREATELPAEWVIVNVEQIGEYRPRDERLFHPPIDNARRCGWRST